jgi:hypothetical protein
MADAQATRVAKVHAILDELGLNPAHIQAVTMENPSASLPYHNAGHCCTVALHCHDGANAHKIGVEKTRLLFLAGLYHDFNHSAGRYSDSVNIANAIAGAVHWCNKLESFGGREIDAIAENIKATIYPGHLFKGKRNISQSIICDADHMQYLEPDAESFIAGIGTETGLKIDAVSTGQFLLAYKPHTIWGVEKLKALRENL